MCGPQVLLDAQLPPRSTGKSYGPWWRSESAVRPLSSRETAGGGGFIRPPLPDGFDDSRAAVRRAEPDGWRFSPAARDGLWQALRGRRDIRRFRPDPVPEEILHRVLEAAHLAPSVGYMQPWRFVVVREEVTKLRIRALAERERLRQAERMDERGRHFLELKVEGIREAPLGLCVLCDRREAPEQVLGRATIPETDLYSTACAVQNLWLAARAEGLGVGWVSFYRPAELRAVLGVPDGIEPVAFLCLGYPDERPIRPGLESAGWASRRPLEELVFEERWLGERVERSHSSRGPRPLPGSSSRVLPAAVAALVHAVSPTDSAAAVAARDRADELVKPVGSLGALERLVERWSAVTGHPPPAPLRAQILICAADHGVAARGTSLFGSQVSGQVAAAAARGETAIAVLARSRGDRLVVADIGLASPTPPGALDRKVARGTADIAAGPAMSPEEVERAVLTGAALAGELGAADCLVAGEIGIGNTTVASALLAGLTGWGAEAVCGRGTGVDPVGLERKRLAVAEAIAANESAEGGPYEILRRLGGLELAALVGAMLGAGATRRPIVLDGFAVSVAALVTVRLCPAVGELLVAGHRSAELAHHLVLTELGLEPLLDLRLRLGEASGAALALPLIENAGRLHTEMATFSSSGVARS